jgi:hypothetical protein
MLFATSSLGSPGTLVARLLGPWPLMFLGCPLAYGSRPAMRVGPPRSTIKGQGLPPWRPRGSRNKEFEWSHESSAIRTRRDGEPSCPPPRALCVLVSERFVRTRERSRDSLFV